jgi:Recombination endonuclease VII
MYIIKQDFQNGVCRNGHPITSDSYSTSESLQGGKMFRCKACRNEQRKEWVENNPEASYRMKVTTKLRQRYGIRSIEERDAFFSEQGNACAICERTDCGWGKGFQNVWHIDHEHGKDGTHRGILCAHCNTALGRLEPFLIRVVQYMIKWSPKFEAALRELLK